MKNRVNTILASIYVSAMIGSSLGQTASAFKLASPLDPSAPQRALTAALAMAGASGYSGAAPVVAVVDAKPAPLSFKSGEEPVLTPAAYERILKNALTKNPIALPPLVGTTLGIAAPGESLPAKQLTFEEASLRHIFTLSLKPRSSDVIFAQRSATGVVTLYLTDPTLKLRAAAVSENGAMRLVPTKQNEAGFTSELKAWASAATDLPVVTTASNG